MIEDVITSNIFSFFNSLFDLQRSLTILKSMLKTTAQMMTADKVVFGMKAQYGIITAKARRTTDPVTYEGYLLDHWGQR